MYTVVQYRLLQRTSSRERCTACSYYDCSTICRTVHLCLIDIWFTSGWTPRACEMISPDGQFVLV